MWNWFLRRKYLGVVHSISHHRSWCIRTEYNQPLTTPTIHRYRTHVVGSNMLESIKHCVAMGGTGLGATGGGGTPPAEVMLRALAASGGIWNPVPGTDTQTQG